MLEKKWSPSRLSATESKASEIALNPEYGSHAIMESLQMISPNSRRRPGERSWNWETVNLNRQWGPVVQMFGEAERHHTFGILIPMCPHWSGWYCLRYSRTTIRVVDSKGALWEVLFHTAHLPSCIQYKRLNDSTKDPSWINQTCAKHSWCWPS